DACTTGWRSAHSKSIFPDFRLTPHDDQRRGRTRGGRTVSGFTPRGHALRGNGWRGLVGSHRLRTVRRRKVLHNLGWREFAAVPVCDCTLLDDALLDVAAHLGHGWTAYAALTRGVQILPGDI